jgi:tripartite-type tricarboxylate transporter receptor subunit TctC
MRSKSSLISICTIAMAAPLAASAAATPEFPVKSIRIVAPGIGGSADFVARMIGLGLTSNAGWQVIIDNRPNGPVSGEIVAKAPPDGYTLLVTANSHWIGPLLAEKTPYDAVRDFQPITQATGSPNVMLVNPALPAKSVKELIDLAKAKPGDLNYGSGAIGASSHLAAELLKAMAKINIVRIPYNSNAAQITDLIGGRIQVMFSNATAAPPHIKSGKLRGLAVTSLKPSALFPDLPAVSATVPGYDSTGMVGVYAPARTPAALVTRLNQEIVRALNRPDVVEKLTNAGVETVAGTPQQFAASVKSDMVKWTKIIKDTGMRAE